MVSNPLLEKVKLPGRMFKLPSGGHLYTNGELGPNVINGEVQVKPLSALAEIKLKNIDLLFSGRAVSEVFAECVPDIKKPFELFGKDVDALMVFLRVATYGSKFSVDYKHDCENAEDHSYEIDLDEYVKTIRDLDPTVLVEQSTVVISTGQNVRLEPLRYSNLVDLMQRSTQGGFDAEPTIEELQDNILKNLCSIIESVDGVKDKTLISEWAKFLTTKDVNLIGAAIEGASQWGTQPQVTLVCKDCGKPMQVDLPTNPIVFFSE